MIKLMAYCNFSYATLGFTTSSCISDLGLDGSVLIIEIFVGGFRAGILSRISV